MRACKDPGKLLRVFQPPLVSKFKMSNVVKSVGATVTESQRRRKLSAISQHIAVAFSLQ